jgi:hypothetical protein
MNKTRILRTLEAKEPEKKREEIKNHFLHRLIDSAASM